MLSGELFSGVGACVWVGQEYAIRGQAQACAGECAFPKQGKSQRLPLLALPLQHSQTATRDFVSHSASLPHILYISNDHTYTICGLRWVKVVLGTILLSR